MTDVRVTELEYSPTINDNYLMMVVSNEAEPDNYKITRANYLVLSYDPAL